MNILLHELRAYRKSTIIWTLSLIAITALFMSFYPSFAKESEGFRNILENYPAAFRDALGINLDTFFSVLGLYSYGLTYITICGAIQAMNLGTSIVSKEVREKTADFLLTRPVTRTTVLTSKLLASFLSILITNVVYLAVSSLVMDQVKTGDYSFKLFVLLSLTLLFIQLIFLSIGIITSVVVPKIKSVITVSLGTVFGFYFLGMFITGDEVKRYISPFNYFETTYIMENSTYETSFLVAGAIFFVLAIAASYFIYRKKDIHSV
jgi:ABC-2 type transport system permease protein